LPTISKTSYEKKSSFSTFQSLTKPNIHIQHSHLAGASKQNQTTTKL